MSNEPTKEATELKNMEYLKYAWISLNVEISGNRQEFCATQAN